VPLTIRWLPIIRVVKEHGGQDASAEESHYGYRFCKRLRTVLILDTFQLNILGSKTENNLSRDIFC